jgi:hypothetical protein
MIPKTMSTGTIDEGTLPKVEQPAGALGIDAVTAPADGATSSALSAPSKVDPQSANFQKSSLLGGSSRALLAIRSCGHRRRHRTPGPSVDDISIYAFHVTLASSSSGGIAEHFTVTRSRELIKPIATALIREAPTEIAEKNRSRSSRKMTTLLFQSRRYPCLRRSS